MAGEDFIHIRLSPAGEKIAGKGGQVRITAGRSSSFLFKAGESQRVTLGYEWNVLLKNERFQGEPIFEITSAPTVSEAAGAAPATSAVKENK